MGGFSVGDNVTWPGADPAINHGAVGQILRFDAKGNAVVKYRGGTKRHVSTGALRAVGIVEIGDEVVWSGSDAETPRGCIGKLMRVDSKGMGLVRFAKGHRRRLPLGELTHPQWNDA